MPYSPDVVTRTVFGQYLQPNGDPAAGTVSITPSSQIRDADDSIILSQAIIIPLDDNGEFTIDIPCTNNTNLYPVNWYYTIRTRTSGAAPTTFKFYLPDGDLTDVDVSVLDTSNKYAPPIPAGSLPTRPIEVYTFTFSGPLRVYTGTGRLYLEGPYTISNIRYTIGELADRDVIVDLRKNGTSIYSTKPRITAGQYTTVANDGLINHVFAAGDYLTLDIIQVGLSQVGRDLTATIRLKRLS